MKNTILYIILILLLFGFLFFLNTITPKEFKWVPTFSRHDKQPFGGYAFEKVLQSSWDKGYFHSYKSIRRLIREKEIPGKNLLILANNFYPEQEELDTLLSFISKGNKVMIAAGSFSNKMKDTLSFNTAHYMYYTGLMQLKPQTFENTRKFEFCSPLLRQKKYEFPSVITGNYFNKIPKQNTSIIAVNDSCQPVIFRDSIGKGEIILCCNPILYTNYGMLHKNNEFITATLSYLYDKPLLRTEFYETGSDENQSFLRYIILNKPLRWALYITLFTILLFMIFTAKRKQKPIPVIKEPENRTMNFVRSLAALYLRKNDNTDIVRKKYVFFAERLKREYAIDIMDEKFNDDLFKRIASKTGYPFNEVRYLFSKLKEIYDGAYIEDSEAVDFIREMDLFVNKKINKTHDNGNI